jgi:hypothetical protein
VALLHPVVERALPVAAAALAAALTSLAVGSFRPSAKMRPAAWTVRRPVAAGSRVVAADLAPLRAPAVPPLPTRSGQPLYATVVLTPGTPLAPGDLTTTPPPKLRPLGPGIVAENVALPAAAVPTGVDVGTTVAVAGSLGASNMAELLAPQARVVDVASEPASLGVGPTRVFTLALPLASALAVAAAAHGGAVTLLPWSIAVPARVRP